MAVTIINPLPPVCFSENIPNIIISGINSTATVSVVLDATSIVENVALTPDAKGNITIFAKQMARGMISATNPEQASYILPILKITAKIGEDTRTTEGAIMPGGVNKDYPISPEWFPANFLTWQPQIIETTRKQLQRLSFVVISDSPQITLQSRLFTVDGIAYEKTIQCEINPFSPTPAFVQVQTDFTSLWAEFCETHELEPLCYDVYGTGFGGDNTSIPTRQYPQRYILRDERHDDLCFGFVNTIGGFDTLMMNGQQILKPKGENITFTNNEHEHELSNGYTSFWEASTGWIDDKRTATQLQDFLKSSDRWIYATGVWKRIIVDEYKIEDTPHELNAYSFKYHLATKDEKRYFDRIELPTPSFPEGDHMIFTPSELAFEADGSSQGISRASIDSSRPWSVTQKPGYITITPSFAQAGTTALDIRCQVNPAGTPRAGEIIFTQDGGKTGQMQVAQRGEYYLRVNGGTAEVTDTIAATGGLKAWPIAANGTVEFSSTNPGMVSSIAIVEGELRADIKWNSGIEPRTMSITVWLTEEPTLRRTITLTQAEFEYFVKLNGSEVNIEESITRDAQEKIYNVESNGTLKVTAAPEISGAIIALNAAKTQLSVKMPLNAATSSRQIVITVGIEEDPAVKRIITLTQNATAYYLRIDNKTANFADSIAAAGGRKAWAIDTNGTPEFSYEESKVGMTGGVGIMDGELYTNIAAHTAQTPRTLTLTVWLKEVPTIKQIITLTQEAFAYFITLEGSVANIVEDIAKTGRDKTYSVASNGALKVSYTPQITGASVSLNAAKTQLTTSFPANTGDAARQIVLTLGINEDATVVRTITLNQQPSTDFLRVVNTNYRVIGVQEEPEVIINTIFVPGVASTLTFSIEASASVVCSLMNGQGEPTTDAQLLTDADGKVTGISIQANAEGARMIMLAIQLAEGAAKMQGLYIMQDAASDNFFNPASKPPRKNYKIFFDTSSIVGSIAEGDGVLISDSTNAPIHLYSLVGEWDSLFGFISDNNTIQIKQSVADELENWRKEKGTESMPMRFDYYSGSELRGSCTITNSQLALSPTLKRELKFEGGGILIPQNEQAGYSNGIRTGVHWNEVSKIEITNKVEAGGEENAGCMILSSFVDGRPYIPWVGYTSAGDFCASAPLNAIMSNLPFVEYINGIFKPLTLTLAAQTTGEEIVYPCWTDAGWSRSSTTKNMRMYGLSGEMIRNFSPIAAGAQAIFGGTQGRGVNLAKQKNWLDNGKFYQQTISVKSGQQYIYSGNCAFEAWRPGGDGAFCYVNPLTIPDGITSVQIFTKKNVSISEIKGKVELGDKVTDWSPAPEDMIAPSNCFFDTVTEEFFENIGAGQMEFIPKE